MTRRNFISGLLVSICNWLGISLFASKAEAKLLSPKTTIIKILVNDKVVGAIQSIDIDETRDINFDKDESGNIINSYPSDITNISVKATRIRFDRLRMEEVFSRGFFHVHSQKIPLQIEMDDGNVETKIKNCWLKSDNKYTYTTKDYIIVENAELEAESITSNGIFKHTKD